MGKELEEGLVLAKKTKELVDEKAEYTDWATRNDIKNKLNQDLTVLLYQNGYAHAVTEQSLDAIESVSHYAEKN